MKRLRVLRRWFKRRFGIARLVCLAILVGLAALRVADPFAVEELRVRTFDGFQVIEPRVKTARPVTVIDIDEKSLAKLGQWPWPRTRVADLIDKLTALGAVVIAFDIVFAEPDRLNPGVAADTIPNLDEDVRAKLRRCRATTKSWPIRSNAPAWCWASPAFPMCSANSTNRCR
jgi:adenylate cyclase